MDITEPPESATVDFESDSVAAGTAASLPSSVGMSMRTYLGSLSDRYWDEVLIDSGGG